MKRPTSVVLSKHEHEDSSSLSPDDGRIRMRWSQWPQHHLRTVCTDDGIQLVMQPASVQCSLYDTYIVRTRSMCTSAGQSTALIVATVRTVPYVERACLPLLCLRPRSTVRTIVSHGVRGACATIFCKKQTPGVTCPCPYSTVRHIC